MMDVGVLTPTSFEVSLNTVHFMTSPAVAMCGVDP